MSQLRCSCLMAVALAWPLLATSQDEEPRWAVWESFALGTERGMGGYPVVSYIPRTFLLYDLNADDAELTVGREFVGATTQDGVRVFVLKESISKGPLGQLLRGPGLIFNNGYKICRKRNCDTSIEESLIAIDPGEVLRLQASEGGVWLLQGSRNTEAIQGFITEAVLERLENQGIVTRSDKIYPRLRTKRDSANLLGLKCGQTKGAAEVVNTARVGRADRLALRIGNVGTVVDSGAQSRIQFARSYGAVGEAYEFRVYEFQDGWETPAARITYVAQIVYDCLTRGPRDLHTKIRYVDLSFEGTIKGKEVAGNTHLAPKSTPGDLLELTGHPYLFSVNSPRQYFDLMLVLARSFPNRALAGYFLSEFNRSCGYEHRSKAACRGHAYID